MNTQQLESFVQVAENLNFARAAEVLNITQSAVSRQIHSLEGELGTRLFLRSTRAVALTPDGLSFLDDAKEILTRLQMAALKIGQHSQMNLEILTIGCINELYLDLLSELLARYRKQIPEIHPFLRIVPSRSILNFFFNGEMDLLLGFPDDIPEREGILYQEIARVPICCVVPANHPFAGRKEIAEAELREQQIILCNSYETPSKAAALQHRLGHLFSPATINYCENTLAALEPLPQPGRILYSCSRDGTDFLWGLLQRQYKKPCGESFSGCGTRIHAGIALTKQHCVSTPWINSIYPYPTIYILDA